MQLKMHLIQDLNDSSVQSLIAKGFAGHFCAAKIIPIKILASRPVIVAHTLEHQQLIAQETLHGSRFHVTGGDHIASDDAFKALELSHRSAEIIELEQVKLKWTMLMALEQECQDIPLDCQFDNKAPTGEHLKKLCK
jgi:hypothetical protein